MSGKTMAEKILSAKVGRDVSAGEIVVAEVDLVYAHDGTAPLAIQVMEETDALSRVFDPSRVALVIDHASPPPTVSAAEVHKKMRAFAKRFGVKLFDVGEGICHQVVAESGLVRPGMLVVGADSHTVTLGALGAFATGVGSTDAAIAMALGRVWLRVPETLKVVLDGSPQPWVTGKDIILGVIGELGADGATYKAVEFHGNAVKRLSMDSRMCISNMCVEMGAKAGMFPVDEVTEGWLREAGISAFRPVAPDPDAEYEDVATFELGSLEPLIAAPPNVDNVKSVVELEGLEVDVVFIGSCTNGRFEDFLLAAKVLKGRKVREGVRCIAVPASRKVYLKLLREGIVEALAEAGCFVAHSTCGPCVGAHLGLLGEGEVVLSTSSRNFMGRMGHREAKIYLASPATAAASAVKGVIADPREFLRG